MNRRTERFLWVIAATGVVASLGAVRVARPEPLPLREPERPALEGRFVSADSLGARVLRTVAGDPFRFARRPSSIPFGASSVQVSPPVASAQVPPLELRGVVGPPWRAVLEGAAGSEMSRLVRSGDTIAGVRVVLVHPDRVTLRTPDTTWTLMLRRP
jgi:hypothetical protein